VSFSPSCQKTFSSKWIIYDASGYAIVNCTPQKKLEQLGQEPQAAQILELLVGEQERPKRAELQENCGLRSRYLQQAIGISGIEAVYVNAWNIFREEEDYQFVLDLSLEFVRRLEVDKPDLLKKINPANSNPASKLYLPLEIAEAVYLLGRYDVRGKFGPTTEQYFDQAILQLLEENGEPYQALRCSFGPRKSGYLLDERVITTNFPEAEIQNLLRRDTEYSAFVAQYLRSFVNPGETTADCASRLCNSLRLVEVLR